VERVSAAFRESRLTTIEINEIEKDDRRRAKMAAVQETIDQVKKIDVDQYKYGFETKIESVRAPKGLDESTVRYISARKNEPQWLLDWRLDSFQRWKTMTEPVRHRRAPKVRHHWPKLILNFSRLTPSSAFL
jgi:hypothetical protein